MADSVNSTDPSRRRMLGGVLTTVAAIGVGAAAMTLLPASADAELVSYGPQLEELYAAFSAALHEYSAAQKAYFDQRPPKPVFDFEAHTHATPKRQRQNQRDWHDRGRAHEAEDRRLRQETRVDDLELAANNLSDELTNALWPLAELKATTIEGLKFKARWAEHDNEVAESLIRDVLELKI